uniref:Brain expressed, associated with NEDD4, 1 n=1 Tax=Maylandia zebra TaxID=106582 RepID=A0A3P9DPD9_9CICH
GISSREASLLVSPLVVAGIVIGLVLFLSCITIIVGSLRKDSRLRNPHLRASYGQSHEVDFCVSTGQDSFSYGGSAGELRSSCLEDFPPGLDFDSYRESQINSVYPDSPPRYDECVGPADAAWFSPSHYPLGLQEQEHQHLASISFPLEAAPPYESMLPEQGQPLPLMPSPGNEPLTTFTSLR